MTTRIKNITDMSFDILGLIEEERRRLSWKSKFTSIMNDLNEDLAVYWYRDGAGDLTAYYLWEFNCSDNEDWGADENDSEDERDTINATAADCQVCGCYHTEYDPCGTQCAS